MNDDEKTVVLPRNNADIQRMKIEKLMKKSDKEIIIPERSQEYTPRAPLEFIRNVWGSSAGAGSGDFHVYRGVRRREYARQKFVSEKAKKEEEDEEYAKKVAQNMKEAEERTAKKRAKRLKKKGKKRGKKPKIEKKESEDEESEEESDESNVKNEEDEVKPETEKKTVDSNGSELS